MPVDLYRAEVQVTHAQEITMKRTNPFIIPLTMLLVCIALDSFAGSATLSKPRKATIAQKELKGRALERVEVDLATLAPRDVGLPAGKSVTILYARF